MASSDVIDMPEYKKMFFDSSSVCPLGPTGLYSLATADDVITLYSVVIGRCLKLPPVFVEPSLTKF